MCMFYTCSARTIFILNHNNVVQDYFCQISVDSYNFLVNVVWLGKKIKGVSFLVYDEATVIWQQSNCNLDAAV